MKKWLKRLRGALGLGLTWAAAWAGVLSLLGLVVQALGVFPGWTFSVANYLSNAVLFGALGFVGGTVFSGILGFLGRRRSFDDLSLPRFAYWGFLGGLSVPIAVWLISPWGVTPGALLGLIPFGLLGAGCSAGSLALARRTRRRALIETRGTVEMGAGERGAGMIEALHESPLPTAERDRQPVMRERPS